VIRTLLERVIPKHMIFVNAFRGNVYNLMVHRHGCRVLQRCFEHVSPEQAMPLLDELHQNAMALMQDEFGVSDIVPLC
jgi:pumilio RNA-binding family